MRLEFRQGNFADNSSQVTNTFSPLVPGTQFTFEGFINRGGDVLNHQVISTVTDLVRTIDGVNTAVVWDRDINNGVLQESEIAFFAQDKGGNVWTLGEYPEEYRNGNFIGAPSTWISGERDAQGGVHMLADPRAGTPRYLQGIVPSIEFHDVAKVIKTGEELSFGGESYTDVLVTEEWDPQDLPATQRKFYAPGVGVIKVTAQNDPEGERLKLTDVKQLSAEELDIVRQEVLKQEDRAYDTSKVYREADPAGRFDRKDAVDGGDGDDGMNGDAGEDLLHGKAGGDTSDGDGGDDGRWGGRGSDTFLFTGLENGRTEIDTIEGHNVAQADPVDLPEDAGSVEAAELADGAWQSTLAGDGDVIGLPGIRGTNGNGILDGLSLV